MDFKSLKFNETDFIGKDISSLPDRVVGKAEYLKKMFDNIAKNEIALGRFNELLDALDGCFKPAGNINCYFTSTTYTVNNNIEFLVPYDVSSGYFKDNLDKTEHKILIPDGYNYAVINATCTLKSGSSGERADLKLVGFNGNGAQSDISRSMSSLDGGSYISSLGWSGPISSFKSLGLKPKYSIASSPRVLAGASFCALFLP